MGYPVAADRVGVADAVLVGDLLEPRLPMGPVGVRGRGRRPQVEVFGCALAHHPLGHLAGFGGGQDRVGGGGLGIGPAHVSQDGHEGLVGCGVDVDRAAVGSGAGLVVVHDAAAAVGLGDARHVALHAGRLVRPGVDGEVVLEHVEAAPAHARDHRRAVVLLDQLVDGSEALPGQDVVPPGDDVRAAEGRVGRKVHLVHGGWSIGFMVLAADIQLVEQAVQQRDEHGVVVVVIDVDLAGGIEHFHV